MAHFYSGVSGQAGEATRMGSKASGINGYVQSWGVRLSVSMWHDHEDDTDSGTISIGAGPSNYNGSRASLGIDDCDTFLRAIGTDEGRKIWNRIEAEMRKLNERGPEIVKRDDRRQAREAKRQQLEMEAREQRKIEWLLTDECTQLFTDIRMAASRRWNVDEEQSGRSMTYDLAEEYRDRFPADLFATYEITDRIERMVWEENEKVLTGKEASDGITANG